MKVAQEYLPSNIKTSFKYSCSLELVCSFHVITNPSHHSNCGDWYEKIVGIVPNPLLLRIADFGNRYAQWTFVMDLFDHFSNNITSQNKHEDNFEESIRKVLACSNEEFAYHFLGGILLYSENTVQKMMSDTDHIWDYCNKDLLKYITASDIKYFISHIDEVKSEMIELMTEYYNCFFKEFWASASPFYRSAIIKKEKETQSRISIPYILSLNPKIAYENGNLLIKKRTKYVIETKKIHELRFIFSIFTYPHLMINIHGDSIAIYENLLIPNIIMSFDTVRDSVKILGDATRITMIRMLQRFVLTNKELASLLNVTPATVSQHLKILKDAGLLISTKKKNTIYYKLDNEKLQSTLKLITNYFASPNPAEVDDF